MGQGAKKSYLVAVGGWDPSGGAGVLADARVFQHYQIPFQAVLTAVTAQAEHTFLHWEPLPIKLFKKQLAAVEGKIFGVKIGMVGTPDHARSLSAWLKKVRPPWVIWDTVLRASAGPSLLKCKSWNLPLQKLLESSTVVTPNIPEAEWMLGRKINDRRAMEAAVRKIYASGKKSGRVVILKGGHLSRHSQPEQVVDLFFDGKRLQFFSATRRKGNPRGTGCTFASAFLAKIYLGEDPENAARSAKRYVLTRLFGPPGL